MNFIKKYFVKRKIKRIEKLLLEIKSMSIVLKVNGYIKEHVELQDCIQEVKKILTDLKASIS
jgi:hypothetical protein